VGVLSYARSRRAASRMIRHNRVTVSKA